MPISGDLSRPCFGLPFDEFAALADQLDAIYHPAYWVNFTYPYRALRATNVSGTLEALRLAALARAKPFHFISTLTVFSGHPPGSYITEDMEPAYGDCLYGGYNQTKWVAEKIVALARARCLSANIYRPGSIGGDTRGGSGNPKDLLWNLVRACIQLGSAPELDMLIDVLPVDYLSEAIVRISLAKSAQNKNFHFHNPCPLSWDELVTRLREAGYELRQKPYAEWRQELVTRAMGSEDIAVAPFLPILKEGIAGEDVFAPEHRLRFDTANVQSAVGKTLVSCPPVRILLDQYVANFIRSGFLAAPSHSSVMPSGDVVVLPSDLSTDHSCAPGQLSPYSSAIEMMSALRSGRVSAVELLDMHWQRIDRYNPTLNAIVMEDRDRAYTAAHAADAALKRQERPALLGIPFTVKDCIDVSDMATTAGLPERRHAVAAQDALIVARLRAAGAIFIGKTNVPPYARDWQTDNPVYGRSCNPWDLSRTPGGSTGGGAAAVAAGLTPIEIGSDLIGSIRLPCAFCGIYGHKPSETVLPRSGHFPGLEIVNPSMTMTVLGPLARHPEDLELVIDVASGPESGEDTAWCLRIPEARHTKLSEYRVAVFPEIPWLPIDEEITRALDGLFDRLGRAGAKVSRAAPVTLDDVDAHFRLNLALLSVLVHCDLGPAERSGLSEAYRSLGDKHDSAWAQGISALASDHFRWLAEREKYRVAFRSFFRDWDVILAPITLGPAFQHMEGTSIWTPPWQESWLTIRGRRVRYGLQGIYPGLANLSGLPATAFPVGFSRTGMPIGLQVIGPYLEDRTPIRFVRLLAEEFGGFRAPTLRRAEPPSWGR